MEQQVNVKGLLGIATFFILALLATQGFYTIESGSVGVLSTFGRFSDEVIEPGLHFKVPLVQEVRVLDVKLQTAHYQNNSRVDDLAIDGVIRKPKIVVLDSKNLSIGMELTVQFGANGAEAKSILEKYGRNYFEKLINPIVRDVVRDVVSKYQAEEIAMKRNAISSELNANLQEKFNQIPFVLKELQLRNIDLPQIVRKKIEEVQLAKQEEQRLAMIEKQAEKNQNIKTIEANTLLIEVTTKAKADGEKKRIEAEASAFEIKTKAKATAEANREIAESLSKELILYKATERWDGAYPKMLMSDGSGLILQLPSAEEKL